MADTSFEELEDAGDGSSDGAQEAGDPQGPFSFLGEGSRAGFSMGSFLEGTGEGSFRNVSQLLLQSGGRKRGKQASFLESQASLLEPQPSPAVHRTGTGSVTLQRKERIRKSMAALDDVVSSQHSPHLKYPSRAAALSSPHLSMAYTPGSLLKESFLQPGWSVEATPSGTPYSTGGVPSESVDAPKAGLSILDESGFTHFVPIQRESGYTHEMSSPPSSLSLNFEETLGAPSSELTTEEEATKVGRVLMKDFHHAVSMHQNPSDVLKLVKAFEMACQEQINVVKSSARCSMFSPMLMELTLERSTWELVYALSSDRAEVELRGGEGEEEEDMNLDLQGLSEQQIVDSYLNSDQTVRQAKIVVDWLEKLTQDKVQGFSMKAQHYADTVCWENTLHDIQNRPNNLHLISEMDPDAPTRQRKNLSELDKKDEFALSRQMFSLVRAGQVTEAQQLCIECNKPWKAAALDGWKFFHDPNVGKSENDELEPVKGNEMREQWKISCWELVKDPYYSDYEKAIYAALSGNLEHLLPVCNSWYDCLWAYFKVMVDLLVEQRLRLCGSSEKELEELPSEYWNSPDSAEIVFQEIESSPSPAIQKECQNLFHIIQKFVILNDLQALVSKIHGWAKDNPTIHQLRFLAHLVLVVQRLGICLGLHVEQEKCTDYLELFVRSLTRGKYNMFVALYASYLPPDLQVSCYAQLLQDVMDRGEQRTCLELGKEAGLDMSAVTKALVENVRNIGMDVSVNASILETAEEEKHTNLDRQKIQVIDWLVFEECQRMEAIGQGNAIMRTFLAMRKYSAASEVFGKIPKDSVEVITRNTVLSADISNALREYNCIGAYLKAQKSFNSWFKHYHLQKMEPPTAPIGGKFTDQVAYEEKYKIYQHEQEVWRCGLEQLAEETENDIYCVLLGDWMEDEDLDEDDSSPADPVRTNQMSLLRQLCLPQLCFLLHTVLHSTAWHHKCLKLADVICSEKHKLYQVFGQHELQKLLSLLQQSSVELLDGGKCDELGYELA